MKQENRVPALLCFEEATPRRPWANKSPQIKAENYANDVGWWNRKLVNKEIARIGTIWKTWKIEDWVWDIEEPWRWAKFPQENRISSCNWFHKSLLNILLGTRFLKLTMGSESDCSLNLPPLVLHVVMRPSSVSKWVMKALLGPQTSLTCNSVLVHHLSAKWKGFQSPRRKQATKYKNSGSFGLYIQEETFTLDI